MLLAKEGQEERAVRREHLRREQEDLLCQTLLPSGLQTRLWGSDRGSGGGRG